MNISGLIELLCQVDAYQELVEALGRDAQGVAPLGLPRFARPVVVAGLYTDLRRPVLVVVPRADQAQKLVQELSSWLNDPRRVTRFPEPTPLPYERAPWGNSSRDGRLATMAGFRVADAPFWNADAHRDPPMVVCSARALAQKTLPPRDFLAHTRPIKVGQIIRLNELLEAWVRAGYQPSTVVEEPATFSRRGGILDICPPGSSVGVRVELFGNEVESLRSFDLATQRSFAPLQSVVIPPAREALPDAGPRVAEKLSSLTGAGSYLGEWRQDLQPLGDGVPFPEIEFYLPYFYQTPGSLLDYLPQGALLLVDDWEGIQGELAEVERRAEQMRAEREAADLLPPDYPSPVLSWGWLSEQFQARQAIVLGGLLDDGRRSGLSDAFSPGPRYGGQVKPMMDHLARLRIQGERAVVISRQAARLAELWREHGVAQRPVDDLSSAPPDGSLTFVRGALGEGFSLRGRLRPTQDGGAAPPLVATKPISLLHLFTDAEVFGWSRPEPRQAPRPRAAAPETFFSDISAGDLVVHIDYGIGRFDGLVTRQIAGLGREYLLVTYAEGDELYVPVHQADRLSRYIAADERRPALHRLGGVSWSQARARAQKEVEEIADDLLDLYAARATVPGHAFSVDTPWQLELEAAFPYVETEDQLRAIAETKRDMESPQPMDRLICGDVGFGKTEVALRAAFKAVMDGKQVGVLVPTTVLAQQHYNSFRQRLAAFPVEVQMLSRFRSRGEQSRILTELAAGRLDIIIGTHRLLQKDVTFKDLGLLIVDEEQRFGVAHKEMLKQMRTEVDVLTMTATPIPRTLYMSLTGVRDISVIDTPPEERLPVHTKVGVHDSQEVRQAILRELDRRGQVFYVHNRVQTINSVARQVQRLVPEARVSVGHGQMSEHELEDVMLSFVAGKVDVLVSTSIIENGLDIPNANTILVDRSEMFGLAQLYQLRGRVGRGARRAHAFFYYRSAADLGADARARLETLAEHTELGAGYSIAMRDLEIRGAGEILGTRQHGQIAAVGFDLYTRLLARAVQQKKAGRQDVAEDHVPESVVAPLPDIATIELPLDSHIPEDYIAESQLRFRLYRRMAGLTSMQAVDLMAAELADRFGPIPDAVDNLLYQLRVKLLASRASVTSIMGADGQIAIRLPGLETTDRAALQRFLGKSSRVSRTAVWLRRDYAGPDAPPWQVLLVQTLERLVDWKF